MGWDGLGNEGRSSGLGSKVSGSRSGFEGSGSKGLGSKGRYVGWVYIQRLGVPIFRWLAKTRRPTTKDQGPNPAKTTNDQRPTSVESLPVFLDLVHPRKPTKPFRKKFGSTDANEVLPNYPEEVTKTSNESTTFPQRFGTTRLQRRENTTNHTAATRTAHGQPELRISPTLSHPRSLSLDRHNARVFFQRSTSTR
jgi:hypothetical protein